jgi:hypothetical protein
VSFGFSPSTLAGLPILQYQNLAVQTTNFVKEVTGPTMTEMSIKTACRLLGCANRTQLAARLGTHPQTVDYWHRRRGGRLPRLWRDRIDLMRCREAKPSRGRETPWRQRECLACGAQPGPSAARGAWLRAAGVEQHQAAVVPRVGRA